MKCPIANYKLKEDAGLGIPSSYFSNILCR